MGHYFDIDDEPAVRSEFQNIDHGCKEAHHQPIPSQFSHLGWDLSAVALAGLCLDSLDDEHMLLMKTLPRIPTKEAVLLYNLLRSVFVYDPAQLTDGTTIA